MAAYIIGAQTLCFTTPARKSIAGRISVGPGTPSFCLQNKSGHNYSARYFTRTSSHGTGPIGC